MNSMANFTVLMVALGTCGAAAPLGGPVPGYILDSRTGAIRPVLGIPGALQLGTPLGLPFGVLSAGFDPAGKFAVVISDEKPSHLYVLPSLVNGGTDDLGSVADGAAVLAVNSTAAAIAAPGQVQFVSALNSAPVLSAVVPASALLGPISAAAIDDAGQCLLLGTSGGTGGAFETLCADGSWKRIFARDGMLLTGISLLNQGQDALLADRGGQQLLKVTAFSQSADISTVAAAVDGLNAPVGVQVSGKRALVADAGAMALFVVDLSGVAGLEIVTLKVAPTRLQLLADRGIAMLNELNDTTMVPFTVLDLRAMQTFFIPTN